MYVLNRVKDGTVQNTWAILSIHLGLKSLLSFARLTTPYFLQVMDLKAKAMRISTTASKRGNGIIGPSQSTSEKKLIRQNLRPT